MPVLFVSKQCTRKQNKTKVYFLINVNRKTFETIFKVN